MSAKDYGFFPSELTGTIYMAKRIKSPHLMSEDRRVVTDNEIIGMFEHYLRHFCKDNNTDTLVIKNGECTIFEVTLKDKQL